MSEFLHATGLAIRVARRWARPGVSGATSRRGARSGRSPGSPSSCSAAATRCSCRRRTRSWRPGSSPTRVSGRAPGGGSPARWARSTPSSTARGPKQPGCGRSTRACRLDPGAAGALPGRDPL